MTENSSSQPAPTRESLFRAEALASRGTKHYGTVIVTGVRASWYLTALFAGLACLVIAFFACFSTTRKVQCQGVVIPPAGLTRITPPQSGIVTEVKVTEGQSVKPGDVMFVVVNERANSTALMTGKSVSGLLASRTESLESEQRRIAGYYAERRKTAQQKSHGIEDDIRRSLEQIALQEKRVQLARDTEKRFGDLRASNYISAAQLQDKQADLIEQQQRLADLHRALSGLRRDHLGTTAEVAELAAQGDRETERLVREAMQVKQEMAENEARRETYVRATQHGVATAITASVGQSVSLDTSMATVIPANTGLEVEVYATSRAIGFIAQGTPVMLRYEAYPYQKFGQYPAVVGEIANASLRPDELRLPAAVLQSGSEPLYRVRLALQHQSVRAYGRDMPLKPGMLVNASLMLETRKLYEWVLEPIYSISGRL